MSGTKTGGQKALEKILARDPNHFRKIGKIGGKISRGGGFAYGEAGLKLARHWGVVGGRKSRRS